MKELITSPQNQRIKEALKLRRKRHRAKSGRLLIEGVRLLEDVIQSDVRPESVFFAPDDVVTNARLEQLLHKIQRENIPLYPCAPLILQSLADTVVPQGVVAVVPRPQLPLPVDATFTLILDRVRDPGNAGTLLRTAEAAGIEQVFLAPETIDPYNDKVLRAAMGAHFRLPIRAYNTWDMLLQCLPSGQAVYVASASASKFYDAVDWSLPAVLVVGGEADGASKVALDAATPLAIPMLGATESLNAAIAGSVILFEAARQRRASTI